MDSSFRTLLQKYNVPGPRYTSYPTVPAWYNLQESDYQESLKSLKAGEKLSLYFHIPFCEKLCHFCGCMQVITSEHSRSAGYVEILLQEIDRVLEFLPEQTRQLTQIHFGGGTPNFLQPEELEKIFTKIRRHFHILPEAEIAIEIHPRTNTTAFSQKLSELGFNRISLGVQDFDDKVQALINRYQTFERTKEVLEELRTLGFQSFNFDLIYGLPGQSLATWQDTLHKVLELSPNRLAVYSYAHVPWIKPVQRSFKDSDLPNPELKLELFETAYQFLTNHGYLSIGMDHFARQEDELHQALESGSLHRNFMGYSTHAEAHQIGFGVSSISYVGGNYFQNQKELGAYESTLRQGQLASFRGFRLKEADHLRRDLITQMMCLGRIDKHLIEQQWKIHFDDYFSEELKQLSALQQDGLVEISSAEIKATKLGQLFLRLIAMPFDAYLPKIQEQAKTPTFSKTV